MCSAAVCAGAEALGGTLQAPPLLYWEGHRGWGWGKSAPSPPAGRLPLWLPATQMGFPRTGGQLGPGLRGQRSWQVLGFPPGITGAITLLYRWAVGDRLFLLPHRSPGVSPDPQPCVLGDHEVWVTGRMDSVCTASGYDCLAISIPSPQKMDPEPMQRCSTGLGEEKRRSHYDLP